MKMIRVVGATLVAASVMAGGGCRTSDIAEQPGIGERSSAAVDHAPHKTADAAEAAAAETMHITNKELEETGPVMIGTGESLEVTGEIWQE